MSEKKKKRIRTVYSHGRTFINAVKAKPCGRCGGSFPPAAMHFHHLSDKSFNIGQKTAWAGHRYIRQVILEICKTELLCANCHAAKTYGNRK